MILSDLRIFLAVATQHSIVAAAERLHLTPSAISKAIQRLEGNLGTELFDRSSRRLVPNASGMRLIGRARELLALAEQTRADLQGGHAAPECRVAGPEVLLWRDTPRIAAALSGYANATMHANAMFEDDALQALENGEASFAVVTGAVIDGKGKLWSADWRAVPLGPVVLNLFAGVNHPLAATRAPGVPGECHASVESVLAYPFACPSRSLFCGEHRGSRADGWRDDTFPRKIRYWTDDLQLLIAFVRRGDALAYLPDFASVEPGLVRLRVAERSVDCTEDAWLVWNGRLAPGWLDAAAHAVASQPA